MYYSYRQGKTLRNNYKNGCNKESDEMSQYLKGQSKQAVLEKMLN